MTRGAIWDKAMLMLFTRSQKLLHPQPAECMALAQSKLCNSFSQWAMPGDISTLNACLPSKLAFWCAEQNAAPQTFHGAMTNLLRSLLGFLQVGAPPALVAHPLPWVEIWCPEGPSPLHPSETPA